MQVEISMAQIDELKDREVSVEGVDIRIVSAINDLEQG